MNKIYTYICDTGKLHIMSRFSYFVILYFVKRLQNENSVPQLPSVWILMVDWIGFTEVHWKWPKAGHSDLSQTEDAPGDRNGWRAAASQGAASELDFTISWSFFSLIGDHPWFQPTSEAHICPVFHTIAKRIPAASKIQQWVPLLRRYKLYTSPMLGLSSTLLTASPVYLTQSSLLGLVTLHPSTLLYAISISLSLQSLLHPTRTPPRIYTFCMAFRVLVF